MTQTVTQAVAKRDEDRTAINFMWSKKSHLATVLPKSVDVEAFLGTAAGALYASKTLMEYAIGNVDSLYVALLDCAALGHLPGTDEYYLTPRKEKGRGKVLGVEGYRGVIERMYRSGAVSKVVVREVCANDSFRYVEGVDDKPAHAFGGSGATGADFFAAASKRGEMVGGYAYAEFVTGAVSRVVILTRDDIHAARAAGGWKSDSDEFSPWNRMDGGENHPEFRGRSMWWKTLAKRLEPWVPTSAEYRRESLRASASAAEHALGQRRAPELPAAVDTSTGEVVDAEIVEDAPAAAPEQGQPGDDKHKALVGIAQQHFRRLGYTDADKAKRLRDATSLVLGAGVPAVSSFTDFTHAELSDLIGLAEKCRDAAAIAKLLGAGEAAGE